MKVAGYLLLVFVLCCNFLHAQNDEQRVRRYLHENLKRETEPEKVWFFQCRYKPGKAWQYVVACIHTTNQKAVTTLLFAERAGDSLNIEPFNFASVESFDHWNMDKSKDKIEEFYITTSIDTGNIDHRYSGIYSFKEGFADTLIKFHSFEYKSLQRPWFAYVPNIVVEQEDLCQLNDINGDGKTDISNRVHRKILNQEPGTNKDVFSYETDYAEYKFVKGKIVKSK